MTSKLEKYIFDTEDVFTTENKELKDSLAKLIEELPSLKKDEWLEIFNLMSSNSTGGKINKKEAYIVSTSKIILGFAQELKYMFAKADKDFSFYNSQKWLDVKTPFLLSFLKIAANKIGIPEYIASSVGFVNKLLKQFIQDAYFEKPTNKNTVYINVENGTIYIDKNGVNLKEHHPKYFLKYKLPIEYSPSIKGKDFLSMLDTLIPSKKLQRTLQESIAQIFVKDFEYNNQICFYTKDKNILTFIVNIFNQIIPNEIIIEHFQSDTATLEYLFIEYQEIKKDSKFLENINVIPCEPIELKDIRRLVHNKASILNWLTEGICNVIRNQKVYIAKESIEVKINFNLVDLFIKDINLIKTDKNPKSTVSTYENVYKQYESFCELQDEEALTKTMFNRELKALGFEATRRESGNVWYAKFA